jgi:SAM-dependent methyltransferase
MYHLSKTRIIQVSLVILLAATAGSLVKFSHAVTYVATKEAESGAPAATPATGTNVPSGMGGTGNTNLLGFIMSPSTDQRWSNVYKQGRDFQLVSSQEIDRFLSYMLLEAPKTCLDLGCGTGQLTRELYHRGYKVMGVDASQEAIQRAKQLIIVSSDQLSYVQVDLEHDNLKEKTEVLAPYGTITCKLVYAFIKDKAAFLEKVRGILHPQGIFVVITPMLKDVDESKKSIAIGDDALALLETYFKKVAIYELNGLTYFIGQRQ